MVETIEATFHQAEAWIAWVESWALWGGVVGAVLVMAWKGKHGRDVTNASLIVLGGFIVVEIEVVMTMISTIASENGLRMLGRAGSAALEKHGGAIKNWMGVWGGVLVLLGATRGVAQIGLMIHRRKGGQLGEIKREVVDRSPTVEVEGKGRGWANGYDLSPTRLQRDRGEDGGGNLDDVRCQVEGHNWEDRINDVKGLGEGVCRTCGSVKVERFSRGVRAMSLFLGGGVGYRWWEIMRPNPEFGGKWVSREYAEVLYRLSEDQLSEDQLSVGGAPQDQAPEDYDGEDTGGSKDVIFCDGMVSYKSPPMNESPPMNNRPLMYDGPLIRVIDGGNGRPELYSKITGEWMCIGEERTLYAYRKRLRRGEETIFNRRDR